MSNVGESCRRNPTPEVLSAFDSCRLYKQNKAVIFVHGHVPRTMLRSFPLRGIVVPTIVRGSTGEITEIPKSEALRTMVPSTLFQISCDHGKSLIRLAAIGNPLPCWSLSIGDGPCEAAERLERLL